MTDHPLPTEWEWATLGDVARVVGGSTPASKNASYWGGEIPWLAVSDLTGYNEKLISRGARSITKAGYASASTQLVPAGTVLFSSRAPIGYVAIAATELCTSQGFKSFVPEAGMSSDYLYWYLRHAKPLAVAAGSGTTFKELSGKSAASLSIPVPPLLEQKAIVDLVERVAAAIAEGVSELHRMAPLGAQFRVSQLRQLLNSEGDDLCFLGDCVEVLDHKRVPVNREERATRPGNIPYYGATGQVGWIDDALFDEQLVLLGEDGVQFFDPFAQKAYIIGGPSWVNNHAHVLRPKEPKIRAEFLRHALNVSNYTGLANGTTRLKLTKSAMLRIRLWVPPIERQDQVIEELDSAFAEVSSAEDVASQLSQLADELVRSMLSRAFRGELTERQPGSEPASLILKRIADARRQQRTTARKNTRAAPAAR